MGSTGQKGKLIVFEGSDGAGKTTQAKLLVDYLKTLKIKVKYMDFPQYYHSFHGETVARLLRGEFGKINEISPYLASLAYALDRASVKDKMNSFLKEGGLIIANRYATSNMAYQAAKFDDIKEKEKFLQWVYELEYKIHKIPKENIVLYLNTPLRISIQLISKKEDRAYLQGKTKDLYEKDLTFQKKVEQMYLYLSKKYKHWMKVECVEKNQLLTPDAIHQKIIKIIDPLIKR